MTRSGEPPDHSGGTRANSGYDAELWRHDQVLRPACDIRRNDHVLDIGCGAGQTTRYAARTATEGKACGIDISAPAIERARELADADGLRNITFELADAQTYRAPPRQFDLAISRFGTMFFDSPVAAFANIGRVLGPAGRLVMMVWQSRERNEWDLAIREALGEPGEPAAIPSGAPDPFSLGEPPVVRRILTTAGLTGITVTDVNEPVYYGPDLAAALGWVRGFTTTAAILKGMDPAAAARAVERLRDTLSARLSQDGVWFDSRAWIISARRG